MKQDKKILIDRINRAAKRYKKELVGKTFLLITDKHSYEFTFKAKNFLHLCGVNTTIKSASSFYRKATSKSGIKSGEISFNSVHPFDLAELKTKYLEILPDVFKKELLVATSIVTKTMKYKIGTTDLEIVICFNNDQNSEGKVVDNILVPWSLRVEYINNSKFESLEEVLYIFSKSTSDELYKEMIFGNADLLHSIDTATRNKISLG